MNGRSLNVTPSPLMSPLISGVYGRPLCRRQIVESFTPYGRSVNAEKINVWSRVKSLRPHEPSSGPNPPISLGPNIPTFGLEKPERASQHEYDELSYARVNVYEPRSEIPSVTRWLPSTVATH